MWKDIKKQMKELDSHLSALSEDMLVGGVALPDDVQNKIRENLTNIYKLLEQTDTIVLSSIARKPSRR